MRLHESSLPRQLAQQHTHQQQQQQNHSAARPVVNHAVNHVPRRMSSGPDLPPTPPPHSRSSSGSHSASQANNTSDTDATSRQASQATLRHPPVTPPDQMSPPTPDVTPPQAQTAIKLPQAIQERSASATNTSGSRTESFTTAREEQMSSDDEGALRNLSRPSLFSTHSAQTVVPVESRTDAQHDVRPAAVEAALRQLNVDPNSYYTPKAREVPAPAYSKLPPASEIERDRNSERKQDQLAPQTITSRRKRQDARVPRSVTEPSSQPMVLEDNVISMAPATRAARYIHTRDSSFTDPSPVSSSRPSLSDSFSVDAKRSSGTSAQSGNSAVVEVMLWDRAAGPRRQRTLRHVKKQHALRAPSAPVGQAEPAAPAARQASLPVEYPEERKARRDTVVASSNRRSLSNGKARREVWSSGAIPVVVVPDRQSSQRNRSREPSLRSTSRSRSRRSASVGSSGMEARRLRESVPPQTSHTRRSRLPADFNTHDEMTIDFPPAIPPRSSSLSAPTSRNVSRSTSIAAASPRVDSSATLPAEKDFVAERRLPKAERTPIASPEDGPARRFSFAQTDNHEDHLDVVSIDNPSGMKYSSRNTPFSIASLETMGTAPEISEAHTVQYYQHQNSSVVVVNHSNRPSEASDRTLDRLVAAPAIVATGPNGSQPVTPTDQQMPLIADDSPLRNPRAPPTPPRPSSSPPSIHLIPATPSGERAAGRGQDPRAGSYFDTSDGSPLRRMSLLRKAFRRRNSIDYPPTASKPPSRLTRTFSLSRQLGKTFDVGLSARTKAEMEWLPTHTRDELEPADERKLHPFWQPKDAHEPCEFGAQCPHHGGKVNVPRRSLSSRMKNVFAIMPVRYDEAYPTALPSPERRTIRRTDSGNLKVMRRRKSAESLQNQNPADSQASPFTDERAAMRRGPVFPKKGGLQRRFSLGSRLDESSLLPRFVADRLTERRREKRTQELRQLISAPTEVRDSVGEVIRRENGQDRRGDFYGRSDIERR